MPFSQSSNTTALAKELALLESLTEKAIRGTMVEDDFKNLYGLFMNVKKNEYVIYADNILANLSKENFHKLVGGMLKIAARESQGASINTFLRNDHIIKYLVVQEGYKNFIGHGVTPHTLLDHYSNLIHDPDCTKAFGNTIGKQRTNVLESIEFNFGFKLKSNLLVEESGKLTLKAPPMNFPAEKPLSEEKIIKASKDMARRAVVGCSKNPAYKELLSARANLDILEKEMAAKFDAKLSKAHLKEINNLVKQHKSLRKEAGVTYELTKGNKFYDLIMSGNEKTIDRLISKMMVDHKDKTPHPAFPSNVDIDALFKNSPPELLLKMSEIAEKMEARRGGDVNSFLDGINKFANGIKRIFSFGLAGVGDTKIKEALQELGKVSLSATTTKDLEGFKEQTAGRFIENLTPMPKEKSERAR